MGDMSEVIPEDEDRGGGGAMEADRANDSSREPREDEEGEDGTDADESGPAPHNA